MTRASDQRLILAHGFTQAAQSWGETQRLLTERGLSSQAIDLPGHGAAAHVRADLAKSADCLVEAGGPGTYVGYSMGGRVALHAALQHPADVERLVLIGATAGIDDDDARADRRRADERLADHIVHVGVEQFIDEWLATPLFGHLTSAQAQRSLRLTNTADGLAASLRLAGTGTQVPLWNHLDGIVAPTLLLVGEHDAKFRAIAERMHDSLPDSTLDVIADSGHSVHLEQPERTVDAIAGWLTGRNAAG